MDALDLVFRRLVVAAQAADALERAIDLGDVLDKLVPYKLARRDGLDTNDDYLHAVMRLVAGERDLVFADDLMQDDLRNELKSPNPDVAVLRTYVNAKIRIAKEPAAKVLAGDVEIDLRPPTPSGEVEVTFEMASASAPEPPSAEPPSTRRVSTPVVADTPDTSCPYCAQELPTDRQVRYCPACGINLRIRRCPGCSAEIESEWKFCVTCGRSAA
ncbi:MAG: zinc ribbon domain-containing protein [Gemmatimonadaceae bacterium]|nr:zinc ribbon domain-containing protein [Gemmatimonadaceae bacterium]